MGWKTKFKLVGVKPGKIMTRQFGVLDFSRDDVPVEKCDRLVKDGFPYLESMPDTKTTKPDKK
ncbi:hypothetical protein E9993_14740 [Labilibacter sediminis]|nr:hypothetical protein E9993_14740 [Labilibacter sediminis]